MSIGFPDLSLIMSPRGSLTWHNFEASIPLKECCQVHAHNSLIRPRVRLRRHGLITNDKFCLIRCAS
jgi:hypothetical protein